MRPRGPEQERTSKAGAGSHSFVVPTHGASTFLDECLHSLASQSELSPIVVSTSTPFPGIEAMASRYGATLRVHAGPGGIGADWNHALRCAETKWVTLAHQDDVYSPEYVGTMLNAVASVPDATFAISLADELRGSRLCRHPLNMLVKRILTEIAFMGRRRVSSRASKRRLLSFGNPIVCPSVMINVDRAKGFGFREDLESNLDWEAWLRLAEGDGSFVLSRRRLVAQRVHESAATTRLVQSNTRAVEDIEMFRQLWPAPVAQSLAWAYRLSYLNRSEIHR